MDIMQLYEQYITWDKNSRTKGEMESLKENIPELTKRLANRMEFGTAGLRARMGAGYSMMNDLTIIQTAQGLVEYMKTQFPDLKQKGFVLGYDARHHSDEWALISANIFLREDIPVYLFPSICPTPFVSFAVKLFEAAGGVMVTASHNPKEDNGYKVYWANSAQIISPHDKGIAAAILANLSPRESSWVSDPKAILEHPLRKDPAPRVLKEYYDAAVSKLNWLPPNLAENCPIKLVYTAMHGVGYAPVLEAVRRFGFNPDTCLVPVVEQVDPDPEFPTVRFPNPEEGRCALDLACSTADKVGAPVILANDPDADRLAVAEKKSDGTWRIFTGNELGALLGAWCWQEWRKVNPDVDVKQVHMLASTVSSKILASIAAVEGFNFHETLTGFKWMGNRAHDLISAGHTVLFAFEEAIGFMCGDGVLDKDGVSALAVIAQMAAQLYSEGRTLSQQLSDIYDKYGFHASNNGYYFCYEQDKLQAMFSRLRDWPEEAEKDCRGYPKACGRFPIANIRDLTADYDSTTGDGRATLPCSKSSQMVTFRLENGCVVTLRTSGTEPKIKWYTELLTKPGDSRESSEMVNELQKVVDDMVKHFYEPEKNGFTAQSA